MSLTKGKEEAAAKVEQMLCCYYSRYGKGKNCDKVGHLPKPTEIDLKPGEILVRVMASSVNPADYKQRQGDTSMIMSTNFPQIHGFDFSGVVEATQSDKFKAGDAVFGSTKGIRRGCLAEHAIIDAEVCCIKPNNVSHEIAASVCLVGITSVMALRACGLKEVDFFNETERHQVLPDDVRVLITGGAGGVGSIAIQIAKLVFNAKTVVTTASAGIKTEFVTELGADSVIDYKSHDFAKELLLRSYDEGKNSEDMLFDAILDCTGECRKCPKLLKCKGGGMVSIVTAATSSSIENWLSSSSPDDRKRVAFGVQGFMDMRLGKAAMDFFSGSKSIQSEIGASQKKRLSEISTKRRNEARTKYMNSNKSRTAGLGVTGKEDKESDISKGCSIRDKINSAATDCQSNLHEHDDMAYEEYRYKESTYSHIIAGGDAGITKILAYLLEKNLLKPCIEKVYPLYDAKLALAYVESKRAKGKIVINCQDIEASK